jgi:hypothetical protein
VATAKRSGTERFVILCNKRWGFKNLGTWVVRDIKGKPGVMSVHSTARALDTSYGTNKAAGREAILWFVEHAAALGLEEVHDYSGISKKGCEAWGRGWRIGRGWKDWSEDDNGGSRHATWIHCELAPKYADMSAGDYEAVWRKVPKP